mmetsp:Transcript_11148/g.21926  ORF Transcript_11148/g.21926 Transcript_11148/m.21926 type:complete len:101 (-) Transcript_11148:249-551(-)
MQRPCMMTGACPICVRMQGANMHATTQLRPYHADLDVHVLHVAGMNTAAVDSNDAIENVLGGGGDEVEDEDDVKSTMSFSSLSLSLLTFLLPMICVFCSP